MQPALGTTRRRVGHASRHLPLAVFGVAAVALAGWAWWMGRGFGLFSDEWNVLIAANRGELLQPFNGHLTLVPQLAYLGLSRTAGLEHYWPYRLVGLAVYIALGAVVAWHAARRATPTVGAMSGIAILWFSAAPLTLFFPLLVNFTLPLACCVAIWLLLDGTKPHDALGAALLAVALASSAVGVVAAVAVVVELLVRRASWRRAAPYAIPCALWVAWWVGFHTSTAQPGGLGALLAFAGREVRASFAALAAGWDPGGWVLLLAYVALIGLATLRWRSFGARAAGALAGFVAFVALTAIGREGIGANGQPLPRIAPDTGRYLFANIVFLLSAAAAMAGPQLHAMRERSERRRSTARAGREGVVAWLGVVIAAALLCTNALALRGDADTYRRDQLHYQRSAPVSLLGARLAGTRVERGRVLPVNFIPVTAGRYLELINRVGAPSLPPRPPDGLDRGATAQADAWLIEDLQVGLAPLHGTADECRKPATSQATTRAAPGQTVVITAGDTPAQVSLARLADAAGATPIGQVKPGKSAALELPASPDPALPWLVVAGGANATVTRCG